VSIANYPKIAKSKFEHKGDFVQGMISLVSRHSGQLSHSGVYAQAGIPSGKYFALSYHINICLEAKKSGREGRFVMNVGVTTVLMESRTGKEALRLVIKPRYFTQDLRNSGHAIWILQILFSSDFSVIIGCSLGLLQNRGWWMQGDD
jgi:hypothetical protein